MRGHRLLAVAFAAATLLVAAPRASAQTELACNYDYVSFNACLHFTYDWGWWTGYAGLDLKMPQRYAQEIVDCGPNFKAELWGDDGGPGKDDYIRPFQIAAGSPQVTSTGISVNAVGNTISPKQMNEDDGRDELYVRFTYIDCHDPGRVHELHTSDIVGEFRP
jgi:hypothetical protein